MLQVGSEALQKPIALRTGGSEWDGAGRGGRGEIVIGEVESATTFLFRKRSQAHGWAGQEQVSHTCVLWKSGLLASSTLRSQG